MDIILYSGGMDSTVLLHEFQREIKLAVSFAYGSRHNSNEIECAAENCRSLEIEHEIIILPLQKIFKSNSLLNSNIDVPEGPYTEERLKSTVVPFRNGILLSLAIGLAEERKFNRVLIANHAGDHTIYPDCRPDFINHMSQAGKTGTFQQVEIFAPYTFLTKREIALKGQKMGVDFRATWSCYKGESVHCGKCSTCLERKEALEGFDPTVYQS